MTTAIDSTGIASSSRAHDPHHSWTRLLVAAVSLAAFADVTVMILAGSVIPPVVVGVALSLLGLALLRRRPRAAIIALGVVSLLLVLSGAPFALPHLAHPESAVDFVHSSIHLGARLVAIVAAAGALRGASAVTARRLGSVAAALLAVTVLAGGIATSRATRDVAEPGDVAVVVRDFAFPSEVRVPAGSTVFVDNDDLNRHTFTVADADLSHELPGRAGVRVRIDLAPGTYDLVCSVPGHESMKADLVVV